MVAFDTPHPFWLFYVCFDPLFGRDHAFMDENFIVNPHCHLFVKMKTNEIAYDY
jgi:hypothetical protein